MVGRHVSPLWASFGTTSPARCASFAKHFCMWGAPLFSLFFFCMFTAAVLLILQKEAFQAAGPLRTERIILIPKGEGTARIAERLSREGVLRTPFLFRVGVEIEKRKGIALKAGEYRFTPGISMQEVVQVLNRGRSIAHPLTIPEGWSTQQIVEFLLRSPILEGPLEMPPTEGTLLPETYHVTRGTTRTEVLHRMQKAHKVLVKKLWATRRADLPLATPEALIILASIVEKETGTAAERPRVAAVFLNRLKKGMRLESDPTILYGIYGGLAWKEPRTLLKNQMQTQTPYNTYRIRGLPPGPIANPGRASLEAVAHPAITQDLFFVADGEGGHVFSETFVQHRRNVRIWREKERNREKERSNDSFPSSQVKGG